MDRVIPEQPESYARFDLEQLYREAIIDFAENDDADRLEWAYHIARSALRSGLPLAAISDIHYGVVRGLSRDEKGPSDREQRLEVFFLEVIAVHDMALKGYRQSIERLEDEVAERKNAEQELLLARDALAHERDELEEKVGERTAEIAARADELRAANEMLVQANREQAEFTYAISHDLKSPANTIKMMLEILRQDYAPVLDDNGKAVLEAAYQTTNRMGAAVEGLLSYASSVEDRNALEEVDLGEILGDVLVDLSADISCSCAQVEVAPLPKVMGNALQLRLLFQNLVSNGLKFTRPDESPRVVVSEGASDASCFRVSVKDAGIGVEEEFQDRIFGLFQRLHTHDSYPGTGIGLAVCRRIAVNHGGDIAVVSKLGEGAEFIVSLKRSGVA